jgi:hypothetical protein
MTPTYRPFEPRSIAALGLLRSHGYRLKAYSVVAGGHPLRRQSFNGGQAAALAELPAPVPAPGRSGAGLLIYHQGHFANYVVVAWWDNENELPIRVFVDDGGGWRAARTHESICVWDLEVIWFERNAWVATALSGTAPEVAMERYLAMRPSREPGRLTHPVRWHRRRDDDTV